ncbi:formylmethanofuran--tetrahydromethanopterin N-formyltransferase [Rhodopirellula sp. P2]|uniref:formylmethanofuran--tetrahydromethanopterin N-formyltransferase n=1 Tax=Rhodopirellula sp. P2 TaxID=2127060 RepID=UPI0023680610|nr:formylmethanofuran--tetrahydromethanopterin N-formyltransferase [Rhodopirellula sp. P2]WDQ17732.1 formylmethanofuran--tetrahydromethanopterin N-formyltransferase [Rhodopirellula sp. P2]
MADSVQSSEPFSIAGVSIADTFAEAFDMKATRLIVTADDRRWCEESATAMCGFGTSVIACGLEIAVEQTLSPEQTPDGRPGVAILAFGMSGKDLEKQIPRRAGQCVLTCPTTALYGGIPGGREVHPKRVPIGKSLRYFGDGNQISKQIQHLDADGKSRPVRYWRIPVMDGEFVCQHDVGRVDAIGGGNFILVGRSMQSVTVASRAAIDAMRELPGIITPFPGGTTRSGSKVGSKYASLFASTNDAFCPALREITPSALPAKANAAIEVVIDGLSFDAIAESMRVGITAACQAGASEGLLSVSAGNYGGKLGRHHFKLHDLFSDESMSSDSEAGQ